jgi:hypothetical protein
VARTYDAITDHLRDWVARQPMFFVGSAPLAADGHVNLSPKGPGGSLRILGDHRVAYLDIAGSGSETIAHLRENGRIVVMLCAFEGPPDTPRSARPRTPAASTTCPRWTPSSRGRSGARGTPHNAEHPGTAQSRTPTVTPASRTAPTGKQRTSRSR